MESVGNESYNFVVFIVMAVITFIVLKMPKKKKK